MHIHILNRTVTGHFTEIQMTDHDKGKSHAGHGKETSAEKRKEEFGDRTVGRGMDSPDSTEAVLDASTGEPDPRATKKASGKSDSSARKR